MDLVLQSQAGSCPIAPGADLTVAISLLQMSVLGLPLLLALFQFVNDHEFPEPEQQITLRTLAYGIVMMAGAFMLWAFYYSAFCMIRSELGATELTNLLFLFMWVMFAIILVILLIQMEQMVGEEMRYSLLAYLGAFGLVATSPAIASSVVRWGAVILAAIVVYMGWIEQTTGLEQAGGRVRAGWRGWSAACEEDESDEGEGWKGWTLCTSESKIRLLGLPCGDRAAQPVKFGARPGNRYTTSPLTCTAYHRNLTVYPSWKSRTVARTIRL